MARPPDGFCSELEVKFLIPSPEDGEAVVAAVGRLGWQAEPLPVRRIEDTYLDTPDGRLRRAGLACRLRRENDRCLVTVKMDGTVAGPMHARPEWEEELAPDSSGLDAIRGGAVAECVAEVVGQTPLDVVMTVVTTRRPSCLRSAGGTLVELAIDDTEAAAPGSPRRCRFAEVELELKHGDPEELAMLAAGLQDELGLEPSTMNKLRRAADVLEVF